MHALAPDTPAHALPRVSPRAGVHAGAREQVRSRAPGQLWPRAASCKTASRKNSSLSRLNSRVRCAPAQTTPRESALFPVASVSGATYYNYFRSYQPNQGRYTQADPTGLDGGWNQFGYAYGNPLSWIDPLGLLPKDKWYGYGGDKGFQSWWHKEKQKGGAWWGSDEPGFDPNKPNDIPNKRCADALFDDYKSRGGKSGGGAGGRGGRGGRGAGGGGRGYE